MCFRQRCRVIFPLGFQQFSETTLRGSVPWLWLKHLNCGYEWRPSFGFVSLLHFHESANYFRTKGQDLQRGKSFNTVKYACVTLEYAIFIRKLFNFIITLSYTFWSSSSESEQEKTSTGESRWQVKASLRLLRKQFGWKSICPSVTRREHAGVA